MNNIASAFIKAKKEFGKVLKVSTNPHFKNKYAPLDVCIEAVDEACLNNGIAMYQETTESDTGVVVETVFLHESGECLRCGKLHVPADKQNAQGYGSALTYARRYSLLAACGIAAEDDDGNDASKKPTRPEGGLSDKQIADITALADEVGTPVNVICKQFGASSLEYIQEQAFATIIKKLNAARKSA